MPSKDFSRGDDQMCHGTRGRWFALGERGRWDNVSPSEQTSSVASLAMLTQLSLFDLSHSFDAVSPLVAVPNTALPLEAVAGAELCKESESRYEAAVVTPSVARVLEPVRIYGEARREDSIQPLGDLARLVLARYEMVARRREEMMRRKAEQPRRSIRVLSPS
jgi:hypothetical protein